MTFLMPSYAAELLSVSAVALPAVVALVWVVAVPESRRRDVPPAKHSPTVFWGLAASAAGLGIFLLMYADRLVA